MPLAFDSIDPHHDVGVHEPPIMFMPDVTIPAVKQIFVTSTTITQPSAMRELVFHPPRRLFDTAVPVLPGDFKRSGCGVLARGSGVYAVALLKSGLKKLALGRPEPPVRGSGVNCIFSADPRC